MNQSIVALAVIALAKAVKTGSGTFATIGNLKYTITVSADDGATTSTSTTLLELGSKQHPKMFGIQPFTEVLFCGQPDLQQ